MTNEEWKSHIEGLTVEDITRALPEVTEKIAQRWIDGKAVPIAYARTPIVQALNGGLSVETKEPTVPSTANQVTGYTPTPTGESDDVTDLDDGEDDSEKSAEPQFDSE